MFEDKNNELQQGDCLELMKEIPDKSIVEKNPNKTMKKY